MYSGCLAQLKAPAPAPANEVPFPEVEAPLSALSAEAPALLDAPAPTVATVEAQVYAPFNASAISSIFNVQEETSLCYCSSNRFVQAVSIARAPLRQNTAMTIDGLAQLPEIEGE